MAADPNSLPTSEPDQLEAATDQAIAACGGNARDAVKALIVANDFLESEVCELMRAASHAYPTFRCELSSLLLSSENGIGWRS